MPNSIAKAVFLSKPMLALEVLMLIIFGFYVGRAVLEKKAVEAQITSLQSEIASLSSEKDSLGQLIEYVQTDSFVQSEAREKLNLTAAGESLLVIPDIDSSEKIPALSRGEIMGESHFVLWWEYFFDNEKLYIE